MRWRTLKIYVAITIMGILLAALIPSMAFIQAKEVMQAGSVAETNAVVGAGHSEGTIGATAVITAAAVAAVTIESKEGSSEPPKGSAAKHP